MTITKKIIYGILILLTAIQFIPKRLNVSAVSTTNDIKNIVNIPAEVATILKNSCYDCHSNNTIYPWYNKLQPIAWFLANHIKEAKEELNFSEFGQYSKRKRRSKLKSIVSQVKKGEMPLNSYIWMHEDAALTATQVKSIEEWVKDVR